MGRQIERAAGQSDAFAIEIGDGFILRRETFKRHPGNEPLPLGRLWRNLESDVPARPRTSDYRFFRGFFGHLLPLSEIVAALRRQPVQAMAHLELPQGRGLDLVHQRAVAIC